MCNMELIPRCNVIEIQGCNRVVNHFIRIWLCLKSSGTQLKHTMGDVRQISQVNIIVCWQRNVLFRFDANVFRGKQFDNPEAE